MRSVAGVLAVSLGLAVPAFAQPEPVPASRVTPTFEMSAAFAGMRIEPGPSLERTILPGWSGTVAAFPFGRFGFAAEVAGGRRTPALEDAVVPDTRVRLSQDTFLIGPAVRILRRNRLTTSWRVLVGVARLRADLPPDLVQEGLVPGQTPAGIGVFEDETVFAAALGSAWDIRLSDALALRLNPSLLLTRFGGETQLSQRLATGVVLRFGGPQRRDAAETK